MERTAAAGRMKYRQDLIVSSPWPAKLTAANTVGIFSRMVIQGKTKSGYNYWVSERGQEIFFLKKLNQAVGLLVQFTLRVFIQLDWYLNTDFQKSSLVVLKL